MTRTAISPRLAMRTFFSTLRLSLRRGRAGRPTGGRDPGPRHHTVHAPYGACHVPEAALRRCPPVRRARLDQPLPAGRGPAGAPRGLVAVADHQTAGRGRLGRRWEAPPGPACCVSVLLRPVLEPDRLHLCTAVVALAAGRRLPQRGRGRAPASSGRTTCVVGGGRWPGSWPRSDPAAPGGPPGLGGRGGGRGLQRRLAGAAGGRRRTSLIEAAGRPVDRDAAARRPARRPRPPGGPTSTTRRAGRGSPTSCAGGRCVTLGRPVRVELAGAPPLVGTAVDLTPEGHLVLVDGRGGRVTWPPATCVHLRRRPGAGGPGRGRPR